MNISLPDALKSFVDEQVSQRGYGTSSEYLRDQDRQQLRGLLLAGAATPSVQEASPEYLDGLRQRVHDAARAPRKASHRKSA